MSEPITGCMEVTLMNKIKTEKYNLMEEIKLEPYSADDLGIEVCQLLKPPLTEEQILERRRKTAERVRKYRERKKNQLLSSLMPTTPEWIMNESRKATATDRTRKNNRRQVSDKEMPSVDSLSPSFEPVEMTEAEEETIDSKGIVNLINQREKQDPLELVRVHISTEEKVQYQHLSRNSRIEDVVTRTNNHASGSILGPNIHGFCYCEKKSNVVPTVTSTKYEHADSTDNIADSGENIFKRKCTSNCRGCVLEVASPLEHFQIPIPSKNLLRCASTYCTKIAVLNIAAQKGLPRATYNFLSTLTSNEMIMTQQQFTRVWHSILLRRVQEVQSKTTCSRVENMIPLDCTGMLVPAPLSDLLHSIGRFHSIATGVIHHTYAPEKPSTGPVEDWWTVDGKILSSWIRMIHMFKNKFVMKEVPLATNFDNKPLMMTQIEVTRRGMVQCMSKTNEIGLTDGYVHMVNDPLYNPSIYGFEDCHLIVSSPVNQDYLRTEYLSSYIISDQVRF